MEDTKQFFLSCLKDHLDGKKSYISKNVNINELYGLAKSHDVAGMIYYQLKDQLSDNRFLQSYSATLYSYAGRNKSFNTVCGRLKDDGVQYIPIKGQVITPLYPVPALRTMGDIDILIHDRDRDKTNQIMAELGYKASSHPEAGVLVFENGVIEYEFHPVLIHEDEEVEKKQYIRFFNDFWSYLDAEGDLKKEFHLLFLFVHLRKHLLNHGAGIRQFMDIAVFTRAYSLDWRWIKEKLSELELTRFAEMAYTLISRWFGIDSPMEQIQLDEDSFTDYTNRILQNGVFGFQSEDDASALVSYSVAHKGLVGRIKHYLGLIFPPYKVLSTRRKYAYLNGKPWLMPVVWLIRIVHTIKDRQLKNRLRLLKIGAEQNRIDMIKDWGM